MSLRLINRAQLRSFLFISEKNTFRTRTNLNIPTPSRFVHKGDPGSASSTYNSFWRLCSIACLGGAGFAFGIFIDSKLPILSKAHAAKRMVKNEANFIADVVEEALPSVVAIEASSVSASGFIVSSDGLILTNALAFPRGDLGRAKVTLWDGRVVPGNVLAVDVQQDLAVLKIAEKDLPYMKLGNSSELRAGEWVVAIGSPMGLKHTVTAGVISTKSRPGHDQRSGRISREFIQTDAAITYGNSGGPLVNLDAEAIGINLSKMAPGISFVVPIDTAKEFLQAVQDKLSGKGDSVSKTYLGVKMVTLSPDIIQPLEAKMGSKGQIVLTEGVLLFQVEKDSPAQKAGMRRGDIIVAIDGKPVLSVDDVYDVTNSGKSSHKFKIVRAGRLFELDVKVR